MKLQLILICFLTLISLTIQGPEYECDSIEEPSKEQCNNLFLEKTECCFVQSTSSSGCKEYDPDLINYDSYVDDHLKEAKIGEINSYIQGHENFDSLETNGIINDLKNLITDKEKIECNSFTKEIDYSTITYT